MHSWRIGTVVAERYKIVSLLGEGSIGTVYLAEDQVLRMRVALKLLRPEYSGEPEILARFEREASAMTTLAHEHIVHAMNFGRTLEGDICLVMEYVDGETLRGVLSRLKPFPVWGGVEIARQLGSALTRAHSIGIVHRDLKPENVMVAWAGEGQPRVKVLDFGMARVLDGTFGQSSPLTRKGAVFGTPEYMPPEQARGRPVDARADQYSLGVMVFEMLAGRRPFRAETAIEMLQAQTSRRPPALHEVAPTIQLELSNVVARMLAKAPDDRFKDIARAVSALVHAASQAPARPSAPDMAPVGKRPPTSEQVGLSKTRQLFSHGDAPTLEQSGRATESAVDRARMITPDGRARPAAADRDDQPREELATETRLPSHATLADQRLPSLHPTNVEALVVLKGAARLGAEADGEGSEVVADLKRAAAAARAAQALHRTLLARLEPLARARGAEFLRCLPPPPARGRDSRSLGVQRLYAYLKGDPKPPTLQVIAGWFTSKHRIEPPELATILQQSLGVPRGVEDDLFAAGMVRNVLAHEQEYELQPERRFEEAEGWIVRSSNGEGIRVAEGTLQWLEWLGVSVLERRVRARPRVP